MIALPAHGRIYLACGSTDMRRGFDGLAVMVQEVLMQDPHSGALFAFKGKRGDLIKLLWWDGQGLCAPSGVATGSSPAQRLGPNEQRQSTPSSKVAN